MSRQRAWKNIDEIKDDDLEPPIKFEDPTENFVIVDGIPIAPKDKLPKLRDLLTKLFSSVGTLVQLLVPTDDAESSMGYCICEYSKKEEAKEALTRLNEYKLDKKHTFLVNAYSDLQKYANVPDEYVAPTFEPLADKSTLYEWLLDERNLDQFVAKWGETVDVSWNTPVPSSTIERKKWSDAYVSWSPRGTYLVTVHLQGLCIWGGAGWTRFGKYAHQAVRKFEFSPCENYLATFSNPHVSDNNEPIPNVHFWDVRNQKMLKSFVVPYWPAFKWSHDDKFFAQLLEGESIHIYDTATMELVGGKALKISGIKEFAWSPSDNYLSYFVPEIKDKPAHTVLISVPNMTELRRTTLYNVKDGKLHWQPSGDHMCVRFERFSNVKGKKTSFNTLEIFRLREKNFPTEQIEVKDTIYTFAWEPKGHRFAFIHTSDVTKMDRVDVSLYTVDKKIKLLKLLEKRTANHLFWSPSGGFLVLAGLRLPPNDSKLLMPQRELVSAPTFSGALEFFNADDLVSVATSEHTNASLAEWDPSGRFFVTVVSQWFQAIDTGYKLWTFQGKEERQMLRDQFFQFSWRPRPQSLLTNQQLKDIKQNLTNYAKQFKAEDKEKKNKGKDEVRKKRMAQRKAFEEYLKGKIEEHQKEDSERRALVVDIPVPKFQTREVMREKVVREEVVEVSDWSEMNE